MNDARTLWALLLHLDEPWSVLRHEASPAHLRHDLWLVQEGPKAWFGLQRRAQQSAEEHVWRHNNIDDWHVHIHVVAPAGTDLSAHLWAGDSGMPFSRGMFRTIVSLIKSGCTLQAVSRVLDIPIGELWRISAQLDPRFLTTPEDIEAARAGSLMDAITIPAIDPVDLSVPPPDDPVWSEVLDGRRNLDVRAFALKLLLTRLRTQWQLIDEPALRNAKAEELYRYFIKNRSSLAWELEQLRR